MAFQYGADGPAGFGYGAGDYSAGVTGTVAGTGTVIGTGAVSGTISSPAPGSITGSAAGVGVIVGVGTVGGTISDPGPGLGALTAEEQRSLYNWVQALARIHGLVHGEPLVVTPTTRTAGPIEQVIAEVGGNVTITRTD